MNSFEAVLYDYFQVSGGAERFALTAAAELDIPCITVSRIYADASKMITSYDGEIHVIGTRLTKQLPRVVESIYCFKSKAEFLSRIRSAVLYSGLYAPMAVAHQKKGHRIYYCHTPPRYAYDMRQNYLDSAQRYTAPFLNLFMTFVQREYQSALEQMDVVLSNSRNVKHRLLQATGIDSTIVYPPVDVAQFKNLGQQNYFVSAARLAPKKNIEKIIKAFLKMPAQQLVVASGGSELVRLRTLAAGAANIRFTGWCSDNEMRTIVGNCRAMIYLPFDEDFGISPVEAMAAGKPVIACASGGLLETIIDGITGTLIPLPVEEHKLIAAVENMTSPRAESMKTACITQARLFSREVFVKNMKSVL